MSQFRISYSSGKWILAIGLLILVLAIAGVTDDTVVNGLLFLLGGPLIIAGALLWAIAVSRQR